MTAKRLTITAAVVLALFTLTVTHAQSTVTTSLTTSLNGSFFFNNGDQSEWIDISGTVHLVIKSIPGNPVIPGNPIRVHANMAGVTGLGRTSGQQYVINGDENFEFDNTLPAALQFEGHYRLIPGNPVIPGNPIAPSPVLPVAFSVSLDEAGVVGNVAAVVNSDELPPPTN